jgi:hypothetical protein
MTDSPLYDQAVERFMARKPACVICGASDWDVSAYAMLAEDADGIFNPMSRSYDAFAAFTCRGCGQTLFVRSGQLRPAHPDPVD